MKNRNTWRAKLKRTFTAVLPVAQNRRGKCVDCGACCQLPNVCPFLKYKAGGRSYCTVHFARPLNCRKYPRVRSEWITEAKCGFWFE